MSSIYEELLGIAMEVDITSQVQDTAQNTFGGSSTGSRNPAGFDGKRDINQVDDIFGLKNKNEPDPNDGAPQGDDGTPSETDETNENPDIDENTDAEAPEENADELSDTDNENNSTTEENSSVSIYKKNQLRDNMILFYDILANNIELLTNSISTINDPESIEVCNKVIENLQSAKDYLFTEIKDGLSKHPYEEILRKYIALRKVYDISAEMLDKHFGNIKVHLGIKNKRSPKK